MKKQTDLLQIDKVPVLNTDKQTLDEYLTEISRYCFKLHIEVKDFGFSVEDSREFWQFMIKNSSEPQYLLMVYIFANKKLLEEEGKDLNDISGQALAELLSKIQDLKTYLNSLKQMTYRDLQIRAIAEYYYMDGLSVIEVVKTLMLTKILPEYDEEDIDLVHEKTNANIIRIKRYFKSFKNYDVQKFDSKLHPFDS